MIHQLLVIQGVQNNYAMVEGLVLSAAESQAHGSDWCGGGIFVEWQ